MLPVVRPVGASRLPEAEESASPLADPPLVGEVSSRVFHPSLNDTTWYDVRSEESPPENPDPSSSRVATSNSQVVALAELLSGTPVTWICLKCRKIHLNMEPSGRGEVTESKVFPGSDSARH